MKKEEIYQPLFDEKKSSQPLFNEKIAKCKCCFLGESLGLDCVNEI